MPRTEELHIPLDSPQTPPQSPVLIPQIEHETERHYQVVPHSTSQKHSQGLASSLLTSESSQCVQGAPRHRVPESRVPCCPLYPTPFRSQAVFVCRVQTHNLPAVNFLSTKPPEFSEKVKPRAGPLVIAVYECQSRGQRAHRRLTQRTWMCGSRQRV